MARLLATASVLLLALVAIAEERAEPPLPSPATPASSPFDPIDAARERFDELKCLLPGRLLGTVDDPGAELCFQAAGLRMCVLAQRYRRDVSWYVSLHGGGTSRACE